MSTNAARSISDEIHNNIIANRDEREGGRGKKKKVVIQVENNDERRSSDARKISYKSAFSILYFSLPSQAYLITEVGKKEVMRPF